MPKRPFTERAERLEWILGYVSGVAVLGIIGYLVWQGLAEPPGADLRIEAAPGSPDGQLRFIARNNGGRTATDVAVSLTLRKGDEVFAERRLVIDYVPSHSEAEGAFMLPAGNEALSRDLVVDGYLDP